MLAVINSARRLYGTGFGRPSLLAAAPVRYGLRGLRAVLGQFFMGGVFHCFMREVHAIGRRDGMGRHFGRECFRGLYASLTSFMYH